MSRAKPDPVRSALAYHRVSSHGLPNRYARSLGFLDWDNQPNPFRLYEGSERRPLARVEPKDDPGPSLAAAYDPRRVEARPVDAASLARLLYDSLALSAWKQLGPARWSLRCNPSSGNLHPTEAYVIAAIPELGEGPTLSHYTPLLHALERRATLAEDRWSALIADGEGVILGLSSITWREAWKYGERAFRYCQHDLGHAIAALGFAAAGLGWQLRGLWSLDDEAVRRSLGLAKPEGPEAELADLLVFAGPRPPSRASEVLPGPELELEGEANALSSEHHRWPILEQVARACARVGPVSLDDAPPPATPEPSADEDRGLRRIVRTRRSAVDFDGTTRLSRAAWLAMLARTLPRPGQVPFAALLGRPRVHLLLFVHRVDEVEPGLYLLLRDPAVQPTLAAAMHAGFDWAPVDSGALELPLWRLELADTRPVAKLLACHQDIAADGAFAVAMLAELEPTLREHGAWMYRHLHWEAGAIGQVLYLEAEAAGVRGTGIGCFFDAGVGELTGVEDGSLASIYHFTVGGPVEDERLSVLEAYHHLS